MATSTSTGGPRPRAGLRRPDLRRAAARGARADLRPCARPRPRRGEPARASPRRSSASTAPRRSTTCARSSRTGSPTSCCPRAPSSPGRSPPSGPGCPSPSSASGSARSSGSSCRSRSRRSRRCARGSGCPTSRRRSPRTSRSRRRCSTRPAPRTRAASASGRSRSSRCPTGGAATARRSCTSRSARSRRRWASSPGSTARRSTRSPRCRSACWSPPAGSTTPPPSARCPRNVHAERWVPQAAVMPHAAAMACHGGFGTVRAGLAAGVPLAVLPLFADQPDNARRVAELGAGVALDDVAGLAPAVAALLADPAYRAGAAAVAADVRALPARRRGGRGASNTCRPGGGGAVARCYLRPPDAAPADHQRAHPHAVPPDRRLRLPVGLRDDRAGRPRRDRRVAVPAADGLAERVRRDPRPRRGLLPARRRPASASPPAGATCRARWCSRRAGARAAAGWSCATCC